MTALVLLSVMQEVDFALGVYVCIYAVYLTSKCASVDNSNLISECSPERKLFI